jgi:uncharacterized membrane protein
MSTFLFYLLVLRLLHIGAGVLWAGSAIFYFLFVEPSVKGLGPAGPRFMQGLIEKRRYPLFMNIVATLTIVAGLLLYWHSSGGLQVNWILSKPGVGFTIGSLVAIAVYGLGFLMIRPRAERLGAIGKAIGAAGGPPTSAQAAELQQLNAEMHSIERVEVVLLAVSLIAMATARYWIF